MVLQIRRVRVQYELYADVWFFTNFIMDCLALKIAGRLMKRRVRAKWLLLAAFIGAAGSLALFLMMNRYLWYQILVHLLINPLMVFICYQVRRWRTFFCQWGITYLSVILLGGLLEWSVSVFGSVRYFAACVLAALGFLWTAEKMLEYFRREKATVYNLLLVTQEGNISSKGFFDTGNLLMDPILGRPVHIIKKEILKNQLDKGELMIHLVPFHSLGREQGLLETVTIEGMYILKEDQPLYLEKPVMGLAEETLFQDGRCDVILNGRSMEC